MTKRYDVITIGGATEDVFFTVDDYVLVDNPADAVRQKLIGFEYGAKVGVPSTLTHFGGGAANTAVSFARLGCKTAAVFMIGSDERGSRIMRNAAAHKVDLRLAGKVASESGVSFVLKTKTGEHVIFTHRGANDRLALDRRVLSYLKKARRLYLTSLTGSWKKILDEVCAAGRPLAWNPGRIQISAGLKALKPYLEQTDILLLNRDEAIELVGQGIKPTSALLKRLFACGPRIVVITDGKKGAAAFAGEKIITSRAANAKEQDTTGVGDAFGSTLVAALDRGYSLKQAMNFAMKNSAAVVSKSGAQNGLRTGRELGI